jgi:heme-degrading monooxygenase HmoA
MNGKEQTMYGVVRKYHIAPGTQGDAVSRAEKEYLARISSAPGFVAFHIIHQEEVGFTVTIFRSQAELEAVQHEATAFVREHLSDLTGGPSEVIQGPVAISKIGSDPHYRGTY